MEEELLAEILASYRGGRGELIPILQEVQNNLGYLSEKVMLDIAKFIGIPESQVYSVASFYAQFRLMPLGRKRITVCRGTACHIRGAPHILDTIEKRVGIKEGETTSDLEYTLETVACIGCCALAPCIRINVDVYGEMTLKKAKELFPDSNEGEKDVQQAI
ncbi:MAG: NADH-quinone oxidoreductase subunit NuoE [Nitrospirota bacterium]